MAKKVTSTGVEIQGDAPRVSPWASYQPEQNWWNWGNWEKITSTWTLYSGFAVPIVDAMAKKKAEAKEKLSDLKAKEEASKVTSTWVEIQWDAPTRLLWAASWNPDMQADSAQKTVVNVPESTSGTGWGQEDWRAGLKNPNQHLENYWDDSSLPYQEHPETLWGTSAKYEGEGVKTTSWEEIDRGLTLDQLDPNYKYWQESQIYGSEHDGYIQSRNDRIAIALWNAWIRDPEGIRTWLEKQPWFMNSSEHDRNNTVMSIYKRMWVEPAKEGEAEWSPAKWEGMNLEDTEWGKIYGKDTPSETNPDAWIKTEVDPLNITNQMNATREANVKAMLSMKPEDIATSILAGTTPYGEQTLRDIQQYYPSFYALIQDSLKVKKGQQDINAITTNGTLDTEKQTEVSTERIQNDKKDWSESVWGDKSEQLLEQANSDMASNKVASSAEEEMNNCQKDIAELQTRLKNLPQEARKAFKSDVPQYLISAYVANKSQEIQDKIGELQSRYNAAMNLYQTEWEKYKWGKEYDLKKQQLEQQQSELTYDMWLKQQQLDRQVVTDKDWNILTYNTETKQWEKKTSNKKYTNADLWRTWDSKAQKYNMTIWEAVNSIWHIIESNDWLAVGTYSPWNGYTYNVYATRQDWMNATIWLLERAYYWLTLEQAAQKWIGKGKNISTAKKVIQDLWMKLTDNLSSDNVMKFIEAIGRWEGTIKNWQTLKDWLNWGKVLWGWTSWVEWGAWTLLKEYFEKWIADFTSKDWENVEKLAGSLENFEKLRDQYFQQAYSGQDNIVWDPTTKAYEVLSSDNTTPIYYRQRLYNLVPTQLKNSEVELKNLYDMAKILYKNNYSADQAALLFYWINLMKDKTGIWEDLVRIARMTWKIDDDAFYGTLWGYLENNDKSGAIRKVEDQVLTKEEAVNEKEARWLIANLLELKKAIKQLPANYEWGWLQWNIYDKLNSLVAEQPEYQNLQTKIATAYAGVRSSLQWKNIQGTEVQAYAWLFPDFTDFNWNIITKVDWLILSTLNDLNWVRGYYWLPTYDVEDVWMGIKQLMIYDERAKLYTPTIKKWTFSQAGAWNTTSWNNANWSTEYEQWQNNTLLNMPK